MLTEKASIQKLRWIMTQLRDPITGCPWDLKQDFASITSHTLEEAYEVVDAIEQKDFVELEKELGDLLFQVIFYSHLGQEQQYFDLDSVIGAICEKLIRRHPNMPSYPQADGKVKVAAGWLIDQSGLKGFQENGVGVHNKQALVLVNYNALQGEAIVKLAMHIKNKVQTLFTICLEPEVRAVFPQGEMKLVEYKHG